MTQTVYTPQRPLDLVLLSPKGPLYRKRGGIFKRSLRYQPLTLTTLSALVPKSLPVNIRLIDESIEELPENFTADLVAMTVITGNAPRAYELAAQMRAKNIPVVLGGPHVTLLPQEALQHADTVCTGYSEQSWPQLIRDFMAGNMQREYRQGADFTLDIPDLPFPERERFDAKHFLTQGVFEATRSCAHNCEFCVAPSAWGRKQFQHPVVWVVEDIRRYVARTGKRKVIFVDLNLVSDIGYAKRLFTALIPLNIQWFGLSTVLIAHNHELMDLMARSGCKGLLLGLETVSDGSLKDAGKKFNGSVDYKELIGDLHRLGIAIQGCFVFGLDHDTTDVFDRTVDLAIDAGIDLPRFSVLTPFPGTPLFKRLEEEQRILTTDWSLYDAQHVVFRPALMSARELELGHERAWKKVYRYRSIAKRLWQARNFKPLALTANLGYRFYAHHLHQYYTCDWPVEHRPAKSGSH
ncbi:B12-binding domain-containing radical SAM protein [Morganella morganii]|uniref:B12-binding domain-containing radical SAM protein n=1 Tax=Morganella morganii TaxID=582 RepID=UPI001299BE7F|nr:radical SAM protein [Morganella morganii]MRE59258.1 radical SAM protein [Morganella morganii]HDU8646525.1 B12-binding domain-containing radical SAM protein [Morganella morganii subsp. morganii]